MNADIEELKQKLAEIDEALEEYGKLLEEKDELEELQDIMTDVIVDQGKGALNSILDVLEKRLKESHAAKDLMEQNINGIISLFRHTQLLKAKEEILNCQNDWDLLKLIELERMENKTKMLRDCDTVTPIIQRWIEAEVDKLSVSCRKCMTAYFCLGDRRGVADFGKCILIDDASTVIDKSCLVDDKQFVINGIEGYLVARVLKAIDADKSLYDENSHTDAQEIESDEEDDFGEEDFDGENDEMDETVWHGATTCDLCNCKIRGELFDGKLRDSIEWAVMCTRCFVLYGEGIGWGRGQKYDQKDDGSFVLVGGGRPEE
jgi:hypothetical protein